MGILTLLRDAGSAGLKLQVRSGELLISGPKSAAHLAQALGARKPEVIETLEMIAGLQHLDRKGESRPNGSPIPARTKVSPLFSWGELSAQRWGPAVGDPEPGVINDRPDYARMRAAPATSDREDDYAREERAAIMTFDGRCP